MSSFVSANGPSTMVFFPPEHCTRRPFELGCSPAPSSITPALTSSSLYLPIAASISSLGITPASLSLLAFTIIMNRMFVHPFYSVDDREGARSTSGARIFLAASQPDGQEKQADRKTVEDAVDAVGDVFPEWGGGVKVPH